MIIQLFQALQFYLFFSLFAVVGWPVTSRFISNKYLAYVSSKPVGFALSGYCVWLLCSFQILDYQDYNKVAALIAVLLAVSFILYYFFKSPTLNAALPSVREILMMEGITLAIYIVYLLLRSHNPNGGSERMMDMALLTAAGKTNYFPFIDPWYAGKTVNYYYYGQYLMSLLSNLVSIPYDITYNLSLVLIYTESVILSAALVYAITGRKRMGMLAAYLVTTAGALYYTGRVIKDVYFQHKTLSIFTATHFYDPSYTIREIPSYSFTVGDLHAHVIALPFFLLGLIFIYTLVNAPKPNAVLVAVMIPLFATSGLINGWDIITLFTLTGLACFIKSARATHGDILHPTKVGLKWLAAPCIIVAGTVFMMLPFIRNFHSPVMGVGFIPAFVIKNNLGNVQYPTSPFALLGLWGIFAVCFALFWRISKSVRRESEFILALMTGGLLLVVGMDLFFVRDIYSIANPPYFRSNTTFKFGIHAWVILCVMFTVLMDNMRRVPRTSLQKYGAILLIAIVVAGGAFYPFNAVRSYYLGNNNAVNISVAQWMQTQEPGDYETVNYINRVVHDRKVIAEAVKDSYSNFSRIASYTGMITPMGWMTHEWTWRFHPPVSGSNDTGWDAVANVSGDIRSLYETSDMADALRIIKKYNIEYVYIGPLELREYPALQEEKFNQISSLVFQTETSKLYIIRF